MDLKEFGRTCMADTSQLSVLGIECIVGFASQRRKLTRLEREEKSLPLLTKNLAKQKSDAGGSYFGSFCLEGTDCASMTMMLPTDIMIQQAGSTMTLPLLVVARPRTSRLIQIGERQQSKHDTLKEYLDCVSCGVRSGGIENTQEDRRQHHDQPAAMPCPPSFAVLHLVPRSFFRQNPRSCHSGSIGIALKLNLI